VISGRLGQHVCALRYSSADSHALEYRFIPQSQGYGLPYPQQFCTIPPRGYGEPDPYVGRSYTSWERYLSICAGKIRALRETGKRPSNRSKGPSKNRRNLVAASQAGQGLGLQPTDDDSATRRTRTLDPPHGLPRSPEVREATIKRTYRTNASPRPALSRSDIRR